MEYQTKIAQEVLGKKNGGSIIEALQSLKDGQGSFQVFPNVGPLEARYLVDEYSWRNRALNKKFVATYADNMKQGTYRWNGESIKIGRNADDGYKPVIMNGYHRLHAIVASGVAVPVSVLFYDPFPTKENVAIMATLDRGKSRNLRDTFMLRGINNGRRASDVCRLLVKFYLSGAPYAGHVLTSDRRIRFTDEMCAQFYFEHTKDIDESLLMQQRFSSAKLSGATAMTALYYHYRFKLGNTDFDGFVRNIASGANLKANSVGLKLRNYLSRFSHRYSPVAGKISEVERNLAIGMAFEHFHHKGDAYFPGFSHKQMNDFLAKHDLPRLFDKGETN